MAINFFVTICQTSLSIQSADCVRRTLSVLWLWHRSGAGSILSPVYVSHRLEAKKLNFKVRMERAALSWRASPTASFLPFFLTVRWSLKIKTFLFLRLAPKLQLLTGWRLCSPPCPDSLDVKLRLACYLFFHLPHELRELQKKPERARSIFDATRDKCCS